MLEVDWAPRADGSRPHRLDAQYISNVRYFTRDEGVPLDSYGKDVLGYDQDSFDDPTPGAGLAAWNDFSPAASVLLIGITGLDNQDSLLADLPPGARIGHDVLATGRGSAAALSLLDGRDAIEQVRAPHDPLAWAVASGWPVRVDVLDRSLISEPEWVASGIRATVPDSLPAVGLKGLHVVFLRRDALQPKQIAGMMLKGSGFVSGSGSVLVPGSKSPPKMPCHFFKHLTSSLVTQF